MTVPITDVKFVNKAEIAGPKYFKDELIALRDLGAATMVQIPGIYLNDPKPATKIVVGIDSNGHLMNNENGKAVLPCPNYCEPPGSGGLVTLSSFLNE